MCLIVFALDTREDLRLVLAGNRDEFHQRPAAPLAWQTVNGVPLLAGQDLQAGGTWLGISATGRFAAVTNYREAGSAPPGAPSRGHLVAQYVCGNLSIEAFLRKLQDSAAALAPYNLLYGDVASGRLQYFSNRAAAPETVRPGVHGLSNHLLNTPWPKIRRCTAGLASLLDVPDAPTDEALFELLADRTGARDGELPDTGIGLERERLLAPPFIIAGPYGTRCSSIVTVSKRGVCRFVERSFNAQGSVTAQRHEQFDIQAP